MPDFAQSPKADGDGHLVEHAKERTELFRGRFLHAFRDTVELPDGKVATREFFRHPGAVMIIPFTRVPSTQSVELVLERQFRYPVGMVMLEWPAGKKDDGEDSLSCAQRELEEETGLRACKWARLPPIRPAIAYSTEVIDVWLATDLVQGRQNLDDGEFLDVVFMGADVFFERCLAGEVTDCKTLAGAFWLRQVLDEKISVDWIEPAEDASL